MKEVDNTQKAYYINLYRKLCEFYNVKTIPRKLFRKLKYSDSKVSKIFGSYKNYRTYCDNLFNESTEQFLQDDDLESDESNYIELNKYYMYNPNTEDYIFKFDSVKNIGKTIVLPKTTVYAILQAYSDFDGTKDTINTIATKYQLSKFIVKKILNVMDITHDALPITPIQIQNHTEDTITKDLLELRKSNINLKFQTEKWKYIQSDALKWNEFEANIFNPFKAVLETWTPPTYSPIKCITSHNADNSLLYITTLSDLHIGNCSDSNYTHYSNTSWNINETKNNILKYIQSIKEELFKYKNPPKNCIVFSLGDLIHSISGTTDKGTPLFKNTKPYGPSQFKEALDILTIYFEFLLSTFKNIEVFSVNGNHDSFADWAIMTMFEKYFHKEKRIVFHIATERWNTFTIGDNLFILEHGYSAFYKSKVPSSSLGKEAYIQRLILNASNIAAQEGKLIKHNYFIMGDRHAHAYQDFPMFEFIILPTLVSSDEYADNLNLKSRSNQLTFLLDKQKGIISTRNHFLD